MKNILIYISPTGSFNNPQSDLLNDSGVAVKVQIENSLGLGWKAEDILLVTNFDFQYGNLMATVLKNVEFVSFKPQASKINVIIDLFEKGIIKNNEVYWFHDIDAFQLQPLKETEANLENADIAMTDYHSHTRWSTGSIFFKISSIDIFYRIKKVVYDDFVDEERALTKLTCIDKKLRDRINKLNITYNFSPRSPNPGYETALKPIRVAHFHPLLGIPKTFYNRPAYFPDQEKTQPITFLPDRLIKLFHYHRVR